MSPEVPVEAAVACAQCGREFAQSDLVQIAGSRVCADCKPAFLSRVMASGAAGASLWRYGGFWIRLGARMIDGLVFAVPFGILAVLLMPALFRLYAQGPSPVNPTFAALGLLTYMVVWFVVAGCYEILMLKYRSATLGKMACGLAVVRSDGRSLSWGVCFGRFFMWNIVTSAIPYLNFILMLVSSIMAGVDGEKRALHDRVCDTRVIYKRSVA